VVYNTQNYWVFGFVQFPKHQRTQHFGNRIYFHFEVGSRGRGEKTPIMLGLLERAIPDDEQSPKIQ
jgi:hypothetical protein